LVFFFDLGGGSGGYGVTDGSGGGSYGGLGPQRGSSYSTPGQPAGYHPYRRT